VASKSDPAPLTGEQREALHALAFDANAFPRGHLNLELLIKWSELCEKSNLELWIAEPVLWEWAEHVAENWQ
jgi:hypothetical protein